MNKKTNNQHQKPEATYVEDVIFENTEKLTAPIETYVKGFLFQLPFFFFFFNTTSYTFFSFSSLANKQFPNFWHRTDKTHRRMHCGLSFQRCAD